MLATVNPSTASGVEDFLGIRRLASPAVVLLNAVMHFLRGGLHKVIQSQSLNTRNLADFGASNFAIAFHTCTAVSVGAARSPQIFGPLDTGSVVGMAIQILLAMPFHVSKHHVPGTRLPWSSFVFAVAHASAVHAMRARLTLVRSQQSLQKTEDVELLLTGLPDLLMLYALAVSWWSVGAVQSYITQTKLARAQAILGNALADAVFASGTTRAICRSLTVIARERRWLDTTSLQTIGVWCL